MSFSEHSKHIYILSFFKHYFCVYRTGQLHVTTEDGVYWDCIESNLHRFTENPRVVFDVNCHVFRRDGCPPSLIMHTGLHTISPTSPIPPRLIVPITYSPGRSPPRTPPPAPRARARAPTPETVSPVLVHRVATPPTVVHGAPLPATPATVLQRPRPPTPETELPVAREINFDAEFPRVRFMSEDDETTASDSEDTVPELVRVVRRRQMARCSGRGRGRGRITRATPYHRASARSTVRTVYRSIGHAILCAADSDSDSEEY